MLGLRNDGQPDLWPVEGGNMSEKHRVVMNLTFAELEAVEEAVAHTAATEALINAYREIMEARSRLSRRLVKRAEKS